MTWTQAGTIQITRDWQYTEPIAQGSYFRLKHTEAPNGGLFAIAQCEVDSEGKLSIGDSQILAAEKGVSDIIKLPKTAYTDRRIAIKKITSLPSLEQEIRRLILPNLLAPIEQEIRYIRRNNWQIDIEVADYAEVETDYTGRFTAIDNQLIAIEQKIDDTSSNPSNGGSNQGTQLNYVSSGDENGVFYYLGSNKKTTTHSNPIDNAIIEGIASSIFTSNTAVRNLADRNQTTNCLSNNLPNSYVGVNLKNYNLLINGYALQGNANEQQFIRNWKLQASNDGTTWTDIDSQANNTTISGYNWLYIPIANQTIRYRYFRVYQTGLNSNNMDFLCIPELELYGNLALIA